MACRVVNLRTYKNEKGVKYYLENIISCSASVYGDKVPNHKSKRTFVKRVQEAYIVSISDRRHPYSFC